MSVRLLTFLFGCVLAVIFYHVQVLYTMPELFLRTASFAAQKHASQKRLDTAGTPYINHPLEVAHLLSVHYHAAGRADVIVAALLHDTVEDTNTTFAELEELFGVDVTNLVREVTDDKSLEKMERKRLQVEHTAHISHGAKAIKMADKISNLRSIQREIPVGWTHERACAYFVWAKQVTDQCRGVCAALEQMLDEIYAKGV